MPLAGIGAAAGSILANSLFQVASFNYQRQQDRRMYRESLPSTQMHRMLEAGFHPTAAFSGMGHSGQGHAAVQQPGSMRIMEQAMLGASIDKVLAEADNVRADTAQKEMQTDYIAEGIRLSQLNQQALQKRMDDGDLSNRHMYFVTEKLWQDIELSIQQQGLTDAKREETIALLKLELARLSHNQRILEQLGLHEHSLTTEAGNVTSAIQQLLNRGWSDRGNFQRVERWFAREREDYEKRFQLLEQRHNKRSFIGP